MVTRAVLAGQVSFDVPKRTYTSPKKMAPYSPWMTGIPSWMP